MFGGWGAHRFQLSSRLVGVPVVGEDTTGQRRGTRWSLSPRAQDGDASTPGDATWSGSTGAGAGFSGSGDGGGEEPPRLTREQGHASMLGTPVRHPGRAPTQLHNSDSALRTHLRPPQPEYASDLNAGIKVFKKKVFI